MNHKYIRSRGIAAMLLAQPALGQAVQPTTTASQVLWYDQPSGNWEAEALPIGNGRLHAMLFGAADKETVQINKDSLWEGEEKDTGWYQNLLKNNIMTNLFDTHPPFQMDCNFGATAGVCEMLLQSQAGEVHLLPALPGAWPNGAVAGLRARGAFEVDMAWADGKLTSVTVRSLAGKVCQVRYGENTAELTMKPGTVVRLGGDLSHK